jgi:quaternary ammonium compound-resistance protein SugE
MAWVYMFSACAFEILWAVSMKYTMGFTRLLPTLITLAAAGISFLLFAKAVPALGVGTSYTVLNGVGTVGAVVFGILLFSESTHPFRLLCVALIVVGVIGLRLTTE